MINDENINAASTCIGLGKTTKTWQDSLSIELNRGKQLQQT
jgi:hypothetical protein